MSLPCPREALLLALLSLTWPRSPTPSQRFCTTQMPQAIPQTWRLILPSWIFLAMHLPQVIGQESCISCVWPITWFSALGHASCSHVQRLGPMVQPLPGSWMRHEEVYLPDTFSAQNVLLYSRCCCLLCYTNASLHSFTDAGLDWADDVVDTTVQQMGQEPKGLPFKPTKQR